MSFAATIAAIVRNLISIVVDGDYIAGDGPNLHEDSAIYEGAYMLAEMIGTIAY